MVYARNIQQFGLIDLLCKENDKTAIMSQNSHVKITSKAGDIISSLKMHIFIIVFISKVYTRHIPCMYVIFLLQPSCWLSWSLKRAWMSQTWTFCGFFLV